ncbi:hypothetical protein SAMN05216298_2413 [Glycomyces sambucus]|uniref:Lipoprotein n=1 Tax=Glycomyces sambucus TaxID=380244 RepID=A0A1G9GT97_9ACTN|nr:hypothetical protein [Glycomyces sambucus]SDL03901.1 hypothetical protein SAMN05216298_2413 [Glycomyces sambucus]
MKRIAKTCTAVGAAALFLAGCNAAEEPSGGDATDGGGGDDPVYAAMSAWDACEVLDGLAPVTDEMGIVGWGSSTAEGGEPGSSAIGNTFDPDALGCNGLFNLGDYEGYTMSGEAQFKIVPAESAEAAATAYESRVAAAESDSAEGQDAVSEAFAGPWDQGTVVSWIGDADQPYTEVVGQDGQWVFHIQLYHSNDYGLRGGGDPALAFTEESLRQWLVDTYLPQVNQAVNDRIAEAG